MKSLAASPVLVGAVTVLVAVVAVFLSYNANHGLQFVPTREIRVQLAGGANVVVGNDVRSGGYRIGVVSAMQPARAAGGRVIALVTLKLDRKAGALPVDSRVAIRARSALGLKYVEVTKGRSRRTIPNGGTLPERQTTVPVELDEFFNMFDRRTRVAVRQGLHGAGDALVGRGADINRFVLDAPELLRRLRLVAANLNLPRTRLPRLIQELEDAARTVAPVSRAAAYAFTAMADTFDALGRDPRALRDTIAKAPATEAVAIRSLRAQRPFLDELAALSDDLRAATGELPAALPPLTRALTAGTRVLPRTVALSDRLAAALRVLAQLARAPTTRGALAGLTATVATLQPQLRYLGPFVTVCNAWNTFWTFVAEHFSAPDETGGTQRITLSDAATQGDAIGTIGANEFAHGPQHLHANTYDQTAVDARGAADCKSGQEGYMFAGNHHTPRPDVYGRAVVDAARDLRARYPGLPSRGSTYAHYDREGRGVGRNPDRVPAGQSFADRPQGRGRLGG